MGHQKVTNLLDNTMKQPPKFGTKIGFKKYDDAHGIYAPNNQIKFKTTIIKSKLCDAYMLFKPQQLLKHQQHIDRTKK